MHADIFMTVQCAILRKIISVVRSSIVNNNLFCEWNGEQVNQRPNMTKGHMECTSIQNMTQLVWTTFHLQHVPIFSVALTKTINLSCDIAFYITFILYCKILCHMKKCAKKFLIDMNLAFSVLIVTHFLLVHETQCCIGSVYLLHF